MDDLITWLRAQLDDDERVARDAGDDAMTWHPGEETVYDDLRTLAVGPYGGMLHESKHIARWDPARVLAEVDAKRRILHEHRTFEGSCLTCSGDQRWKHVAAPCPTVRLLALPSADREGYRSEWAP